MKIMGFFFKSKEEKLAIRRAEEEAKRAERQNTIAKYQPFNDFLNQVAQEFVSQLESQGIHPTWGFEWQPHIDVMAPGDSAKKVDNVTIFDVPKMKGLVFDDTSKKCVYYSCGEYKYSSGGQFGKNKYQYHVFDYEDLLSVKVEVNDTVSFQSQTNTTNVVGRSMIGGIVGGSAGAIIAGATSPQSTTTKVSTVIKKVCFFMQTTHPDCRVVKFSIHRHLLQPENRVGAEEELGNAMSSTFSDQPYLMKDGNLQRNHGTYIDCYFKRNGDGWNDDSEPWLAHMDVRVGRK